MSSLWCHPKAQVSLIHPLDNFLILFYQNKHHVSAVISASFHMHKYTHLVMEIWEIIPLNTLAR